MRVETLWEQPCFVNPQKEIHLASRALNVLQPDAAEEYDDGGKVDRSEIGCDVRDPIGSYILDLPAGSAQGDVVENSLQLLWLPPGDL